MERNALEWNGMELHGMERHFQIYTNLGTQKSKIPISQHSDLGLSGVFATSPPRRVSIKDLSLSPGGAMATRVINPTIQKVGLEPDPLLYK